MIKNELNGGLIYRVHHQRKTKDSVKLPKGGETIVEVGQLVPEEDGRKTFASMAVGHARCSKLDNYDKKRGRDIALGRALKALRLTEEALNAVQ